MTDPTYDEITRKRLGDEIIELSEQGLGENEIAERLGVSGHMVGSVRSRRGYQIDSEMPDAAKQLDPTIKGDRRAFDRD